MERQELVNRILIAASNAENAGFEHTSKALIDMVWQVENQKTTDSKGDLWPKNTAPAEFERHG